MAGDKFRFLFDDFPPSYRGYCFFYEIELIDGADVLDNAEGTASASSELSSASYACDDNDTSGWHSNYAGETAHWWRFDLDSTTGIDPTSYTFRARNDGYSGSDTPIAWRLQKWIVDEWVTIHQVVDEPIWSANEKRTFNISGGPRFRFRFDDFPPSYRGYCAFVEIELLVGAVDVLDEADGLSEGSSVYSTYVASGAIDDSTSTLWHSDYAGETAHWWRFSFDALDEIIPTSYSFRARNDSFVVSDTPIAWTLQQYNYDTWEWDDVHAVVGEDPWSANEKRIFYTGITLGNVSGNFFLFL